MEKIHGRSTMGKIKFDHFNCRRKPKVGMQVDQGVLRYFAFLEIAQMSSALSHFKQRLCSGQGRFETEV
jgi:hypothetical protein